MSILSEALLNFVPTPRMLAALKATERWSVMKRKDIKNSEMANNPARDGQTCNSPTRKAFWADETRMWGACDVERAAALEDGDIVKAIACIKEMEKLVCPLPDRHDHQHCYVENERKRAERLIDPLNNDPTFRELLGIKTYAAFMAECHNDCCRFDFLKERDQPHLYRIPHDRAQPSQLNDSTLLSKTALIVRGELLIS